MSKEVPQSVIDIQKRLYREALIKQHHLKRGSKFYPFNIEPFALERDRLALPFTDDDRLLRKQWLEDQKLTAREPVSVPEWTRVNIFRRIYRAPYDLLENSLIPIMGELNAYRIRWLVPKVIGSLLFTWTAWYHIKYSPMTWETGNRGFGSGRTTRPKIYPGDPAWPGIPPGEEKFAMQGFYERKALRGEKFVTSSS